MAATQQQKQTLEDHIRYLEYVTEEIAKALRLKLKPIDKIIEERVTRELIKKKEHRLGKLLDEYINPVLVVSEKPVYFSTPKGFMVSTLDRTSTGLLKERPIAQVEEGSSGKAQIDPGRTGIYGNPSVQLVFGEGTGKVWSVHLDVREFVDYIMAGRFVLNDYKLSTED